MSSKECLICHSKNIKIDKKFDFGTTWYACLNCGANGIKDRDGESWTKETHIATKN